MGAKTCETGSGQSHAQAEQLNGILRVAIYLERGASDSYLGDGGRETAQDLRAWGRSKFFTLSASQDPKWRCVLVMAPVARASSLIMPKFHSLHCPIGK